MPSIARLDTKLGLSSSSYSDARPSDDAQHIVVARKTVKQNETIGDQFETIYSSFILYVIWEKYR